MQPFVVKLTDLPRGISQHDASIGKEFFETFENSEILNADIGVAADLNYHGLTIDVSCDILGTVTVACDRCLEALEIPVETSFEESYSVDGTELNFGQDVYDFICVALPLQRVHDQEECNQETIKYLGK